MAFTLTAADGRDFVDRKDFVDEMVGTLSSRNVRMGFALYGRRRVGKSSVLLNVAERLRGAGGVVPVYVSVWDLVENTLEEFSLKLAELVMEEYRPKLGIKQRISDLRDTPMNVLKDVLSENKVGVSVADVEFFIHRGREIERKPGELLGEAFGLAEKFAGKTKTRCVLLIDEFPSLIDLKLNGHKAGEQIIKKIRSVNELQKNTVLCISGSLKHTMDLTVFSSTSAFYRQLIPKEVKPLDGRFIREILVNGLGDRFSAGALARVVEFTHGMPFYAQAVGKELEHYDGELGEREVSGAIDSFLENVGSILFNSEFMQLSPKERLVVLSMAGGGGKSFTEVKNAVGDDVSNIGTYLRSLEEKGVVEKNGGGGAYALADPVFRLWIKRKYGD